MKKLLLLNFLGLAIAVNSNAQQNVTDAVLPKWRFSADAGYSTRTASAPDGATEFQKSYINSMRSGFNFNLEGAYIFSRDWSLGAKYNRYSSFKGQINDVTENVYIDFIAATTTGQFITNNGKHLFVMGIGIGYIGFQNKITQQGLSGTINGSSVGFSLDVAYDLKIAKKFAIGPRISYMGGTIKNFTMSNGQSLNLENDEKESLARLDFSLGLRLYL